MKSAPTRPPETWPCKCVSRRLSNFSPRRWAKSKMPASCWTRSLSLYCPLRECRRLSNKACVFPVIAPETDCGTSRREDFWFIVAARSEDEAEIRVGQSAGRASSEGHSASDPPAVFGGREDPHRAGRAARGGEHLRALPPRRHRGLALLRLVQGVPGGRQTSIGRRYGTRRNLRRSEGPSP